MATTWTSTRCGHSHTDETCGHDKSETLDDLCRHCRKARIGQVIRFVRFGDFPTNGRSRNGRDQFSEDGVSVYELIGGRADLVGWCFGFTGRVAYRGTGEIIGWGSDGEPLVRVTTSRKISPKERAKLLGEETTKSRRDRP